jgi:hypothetical protein
MTESVAGVVDSIAAPVVSREGASRNSPARHPRRPVQRGADGKYLQFIPETQRLVEFSRQPAVALPRRPEGHRRAVETRRYRFPFAIDPVRGQLLEILTQAPNLRRAHRPGRRHRLRHHHPGRGIGVLLALWRLLVLYREDPR